ncbi:MAG TPA: DUF5985 family protein [Aggregicoccus sp.]|nr:DUF5985 family protein [Aggregicoccus sp.]
MAEAVYVLCALTSAACAALLLRGYKRSGHRLLFWSGLCFVALFFNNLFLVLDKIVYPEPTVDLSLVRTLFAVLGVGTLLFGLIWESE